MRIDSLDGDLAIVVFSGSLKGVHSQSVLSAFDQVPGLNVIVPTPGSEDDIRRLRIKPDVALVRNVRWIPASPSGLTVLRRLGPTALSLIALNSGSKPVTLPFAARRERPVPS